MNRFTALYILPMMLSAGAVASCAGGPSLPYDYQSATSTHIQTALPSQAAMPKRAFIANSEQQWWTVFDDPALNALVEHALSRSFDVRSAIADVERAEAAIRGANAGLAPNISANAQSNSGAILESGSDIATSGRLSLDADWNTDLFGQVRHSVRASKAQADQTAATKRDVQRLVVARTVQAYIAYRSTQERIALSKRNIERLGENAKRVTRLVDGGYNTVLDLRRSENQIFEQKAALTALELEETTALNALSLLLGTSPATLKRSISASNVTIALPSQIPEPQIDVLTRHRPDIRSAQWNLIASAYGVDAAKAALYPSVQLSSRIFSDARGQGGWPELGSLSGALISSVAAPLLGRGRIFANIDQRRADVDKALINYERAVLNTLLEVDEGLSRWQGTNKRLEYRKAGLESAVESQQLAERLFYAGELDYTSVLVAEQTRLQAEDNHLIARNDALGAYVNYVAAVAPSW